METEEKIVYSILEIVNKGIHSDDNKIDERVIRALLKPYRASVLAKASINGYLTPDECFQSLGAFKFTRTKGRIFSAELPKILRFKDNFGLYFRINGEEFAVVDSESFFLASKSIISKRLPRAKIEGSLATIYIGEALISGNVLYPKKNYLIEDLEANAKQNNFEYITVETMAILDDTDLGTGYDWTVSPYPMPSELIAEMKLMILAKEFNIIAQANPDKTTDGNDKGSVGGNPQQEE